MTNCMDNVSDIEGDNISGDDAAGQAYASPATHEFVRADQSSKVMIDPPHPSTQLFAERMQELVSNHNVRMLDNDEVRKLTPLRIQRLLKEQAPDLPVSQTQIYRYYHGEAPPRLDVVYELARFFDVPPTYFVVDNVADIDADRSAANAVYTSPSLNAAKGGTKQKSKDAPKGKELIDPPHVATIYFSRQLQKLAASLKVRMLDTDRIRKLTPLGIQRLLKEQAPDLPVSQTQIYRYYHGQAPPRLDVVYELSRLFGVPRSYFIPDGFLPE